MAISEFQLALIGAGAAAVVGVWSYNSWQEYRHRKIAEKIFSNRQQGALADTEPTDGDATNENGNATPVPRNELRIEPVLVLPEREESLRDEEPEALASEDGARPVAMPVDKPSEIQLDAMIELGIAFPRDATVAALYAVWPRNADLRKSVRWIARDEQSSDWREITEAESASARDAYVTIQLADRQGAISIAELTAFYKAAETAAVTRGGRIDIPVLDEIAAHARALDDICASVDIQIAIHIIGRSGQAFAGTKLRGLLEASGLKLAPDGLFYLVDDDGRRLFSVCNSGAVPFELELMRTGTIADVTFWLDVPRVDDGGAVFDIMLAIARQLVESLDGQLVDDQRNPLADNVLAGIRAKVVELQAQMAAQGIPAGGCRALRLFA